MNGLRLTVLETSKILGVSPQFIRYMLIQGKLPIGKAIKNSKNSKYIYLIYRPMVEEFIGNNGWAKLEELESGK